MLTSILRGMAAGAVATGVMTLGMAIAKEAGLLGEAPPRKIVRKLLGRRDHVTTGLAHVGFGGAMGGLYALACGLGIRLPLPRVVQGALFGTGVWAVSYGKVLPELGIMAPPKYDRPGRPASMVAAHWIYGPVLGALAR